MSTGEMRARPTAHHTASPSRPVRIAANAAIAGLWLWLYRPVFDYLAIIFSREDFRTNQVVLIAVIVLIASRMRKGRMHLRIDLAPQLFPSALILALAGSLLFLVVERFLDVNTISASLFGLASYGLLGLWLEPRRWRQGLPATLLLIGTLPFGEHMQTFVGYPMRILTATIVRDGLAGAGVASVGVDTILVFENGVSQVDLPCSGVKSLWTGMLFLIAATWIERRPINLRWILSALIFVALLFTANLARVGVLVTVGQVVGWRLVAEMLHVPLGVLGFVAACAAAVMLLRFQPASQEIGKRRLEIGDPRLETGGSPISDLPWPTRQPVLAGPGGRQSHLMPKRPIWLAPALAATILAMALIYTPRPQTGLTQSPPAWEFPAGLVTEPMPLKPDEVEWLTRDGAESADRRRFEWRGITGSMILISSTTWRAQHRPERCFEVYGLSLDDSRTYLVVPNFPVRFVSLSDGDGYVRSSATYWLQSADRTTDDYGTRIWADLAPKRQRWILVTILFDGVYDPHSTDIQAFYTALHAAVAQSLKGGPS
jgi:exosortase/archaeosortase family protein